MRRHHVRYGRQHISIIIHTQGKGDSLCVVAKRCSKRNTDSSSRLLIRRTFNVLIRRINSCTRRWLPFFYFYFMVKYNSHKIPLKRDHAYPEDVCANCQDIFLGLFYHSVA
uniref:Uncharacterized protein n=1 Tax=Rhipicephalus zambeziensis TaxID=60191 RepID=A0A224Y6V4_9ACAR